MKRTLEARFILRLLLSGILSQALLSSIATAAPLCSQAFIFSELTTEQINITVAELAKLKIQLDIAKVEGSIFPRKHLEDKFNETIESLQNDPRVGMTAAQVKLQIQNEIYRLQNQSSSTKKREAAVRKTEKPLIEKRKVVFPLATKEQLTEQEARAKALVARYDAKAIEMTYLKRFKAKKWNPDGRSITKEEPTVRDQILIEISSMLGQPWARIELLNEKDQVIGEALWPIYSPRNFIPYHTMLYESLGEAWSTNNFFNVKKLNIVTVSHLKEEISNYEINAAIQVKRWLEVMEFKDVDVSTSVIYKTNKLTATLKAEKTWKNGDYASDWNDFHTNPQNGLGEFNAITPYSVHIHANKLMWVRSRNNTEVYETLWERYKDSLEN